jgi:hypothetical protein
VALTTLPGLDDPIDLVNISWTPADSSTALTGPPAITPVPGEAGFMNTLAAPKRPTTSWEIVRNFGGFAVADANLAIAVTGSHQSGEFESFAAFDNLGHSVDIDYFFGKLSLLDIFEHYQEKNLAKLVKILIRLYARHRPMP